MKTKAFLILDDITSCITFIHCHDKLAMKKVADNWLLMQSVKLWWTQTFVILSQVSYRKLLLNDLKRHSFGKYFKTTRWWKVFVYSAHRQLSLIAGWQSGLTIYFLSSSNFVEKNIFRSDKNHKECHRTLEGSFHVIESTWKSAVNINTVQIFVASS